MANDHVTEEIVDAVRRTVAISREHARAVLEAAIASAPQAALTSPQPSDEDVERVAKAVRRNLFVRTRRLSAFDETLPPTANELDDARAAIAAMAPRPQAGMISADRACEIVGALIEQYEAPSARDIQEACNTIRMEASALLEPPKE